MKTRSTILLGFCSILGAFASAVPAQQLRFGVRDAQVIVTARHTGIRPLGNNLFVHSFETAESIKGEGPTRFSIIERKRISDQPRPIPGKELRLFCLVPDKQIKPPQRFGPYFRIPGYQGSNPVISQDSSKDTNLRLVQILLESEKGTRSPKKTTDALLSLALTAKGPAHVEALQVIRSRSTLLDALTPLQLSNALSRAVGETEDIPFKVSLASMCGERRVDRVVESLCIGLQKVSDARYSKAIGRIANYVHGEDAYGVLRPLLLKTRNPKVRTDLLLALGATETDAALEALLKYRKANGKGEAVDAALRAHGSRRALEAVATKVERKRTQQPQKK